MFCLTFGESSQGLNVGNGLLAHLCELRNDILYKLILYNFYNLFFITLYKESNLHFGINKRNIFLLTQLKTISLAYFYSPHSRANAS